MKTRQDFRKLAELILQIMVESPSTNCPIDFKASEKSINLTTDAIQKDYESGYIKEDDNGELYNVWACDNYGGHYDKEILKAEKKFLKSIKHQ